MSTISETGQCLCGDLKYRATAQPIHTTICHCRMCQRSTGTAFLVEPIFMRDSIELLAGEPKQYTHTSDESGLSLYVNFCGNCGSKIYQTFERFPEVIGVFAGTFDNPDWFERSPENTRHIFTRSAIKGTVLPKDFTIYEEHTRTLGQTESNEHQILTAHKMVT